MMMIMISKWLLVWTTSIMMMAVPTDGFSSSKMINKLLSPRNSIGKFATKDTMTSSSSSRRVFPLDHYEYDDDHNSDDEDGILQSSSGSNSDDIYVMVARKQLQALLEKTPNRSSSSSSSSSSDSSVTSKTSFDVEFSLSKFLDTNVDDIDWEQLGRRTRPLSSIERDRRLTEIQLLEQLSHGDTASAALKSLWYNERGPNAYKKLQNADQLMASGEEEQQQQDPTAATKYQQCESILVNLIDEYGMEFVEPLNRLATLYYIQGKYQQSYQLCKLVLTFKPYHIATLNGIVQVCIHNRQRDLARMYAQQTLPNLVASTSFPPFDTTIEDGTPINPKRIEWVHTAVQQAKQLLSKAETVTKEQFLGRPEEYYIQFPTAKKGTSSSPNGLEDEDDAWQ